MTQEKKKQKLVNCFFVCGQKTASTWMWQCLQEHPDAFTTKLDRINFFSLNYFRGFDWYHDRFKEAKEEIVLCDFTPASYRNPKSAQRIFQYNPAAKIIINLRNPFDRTSSHYGHHRKNGRKILVDINTTFDMGGGVGREDLFYLWIEPSIYFAKIKQYFDVFPRNQIKVNIYEDIKKDATAFLKSNFKFLGIDDTYEPISINKKVNAYKKPSAFLPIKLTLKKLLKGEIIAYTLDECKKYLNTRDLKLSTKEHLSPETRKKMNYFFKEDIEALSDFLDIDLSHWLIADT